MKRSIDGDSKSWKLWMINACKLNNKSSSIKLELSEPSTRKSRSGLSRKGNLVLAVRRPMVMTHKTKGKFQHKWEGPFVVELVYSNGAYRLITPDSDMLMMPINGRFLKKYYP